MRKNPNFDYRSFEQKRKRMEQALRDLGDDLEDEGAMAVLETALRENRDTIEFLKYMTPFYFEIIERRLFDMAKGLDPEDCRYLVENLLGVDSEETDIRIEEWVFAKVKELYDRCGDLIFQVLAELRAEYLRQNPQLDPEDVFEFTASSLLKKGIYGTLSDEEADGVYFKTTHYDIEMDGIGYVGLVYLFLNTLGMGQAHIWVFSSLYVKQLPIKRESEFSLGEAFDRLIPDIKETMPMWLHSQVYTCDFYCVGAHFTDFGVNENFTVTPSSIRTKTRDYKNTHVATFGRVIESVTVDQAPRGLIFSWSEENLCHGRAGKLIPYSDENMQDYGENCIYIFASAIVSLYKPGDYDLQSVVLLNAIEETIPCRIEFVYPRYISFLGAEGDQPLFVVDDRGRGPVPFPCYVLNELRKLMKSRRYRTSDDLNSVPYIPFETVKRHLRDSNLT